MHACMPTRAMSLQPGVQPATTSVPTCCFALAMKLAFLGAPNTIVHSRTRRLTPCAAACACFFLTSHARLRRRRPTAETTAVRWPRAARKPRSEGPRCAHRQYSRQTIRGLHATKTPTTPSQSTYTPHQANETRRSTDVALCSPSGPF
jgi:hypothetical protein